MALTVGELVAYIRADGTQFDQQIDRSGQKMTGLGTLVTNGTKAIATAFTAATATAGALGVAVFKVGADYNRLQQSSRAALSTLLGGAEAANAQMDKLDDFARNSPFAKQVFITAQQQLLGFGVEAGRVLPILDAVQNAVAAVGGGNQEVSQVTYALAQMQGQGKLTGETLNQLGQYGIDAAGIIGAEMGKTGAEIRELASKPGGIAVDKVWDPLVDGLMERFGGATAGIKQQFDGAADRIKGAWRDIGSVLAAPFIDPNGGGRAVEWANKVADALRALEQKARPLVDLLVARFTPALDRVTPALDGVRSAINGWDLSQINGQLNTLRTYAPLIAPVAAGLAALGGSQVLGPLARFLPVLNPVVAGIAALVAVSPELRAAGGEFSKALSPLVPVASELGGVLANSLLVAMDELTPAVLDLLLAGADLAVTFGDSLGPAAIAVAGSLGPVAEIVANIVGVVTDLPTPILLAVGAFLALRSMGAVGAVDAVWASVRGLATTVKGLSFSSIGTGLMSAFGGPVGIAIAAVTTALSVWMTRTSESKARVRELTDAIDENTGAWGENAREVTYNMLEASGAIAKAKEAGVDLGDVVSAALDPQSEAAERLKSRLAELEAAYVSIVDTEGVDSYDALFGDSAVKYQALVDLMLKIGNTQDEAGAAQEAYADKQRAGAGTTRDATGATQENTTAIRDNIDAQREASGAVLSQREAQLRGEEQQASFTEAVNRAAEAQKNYDTIVNDSSKTDEEKAAALADLESANRGVESSLLATVRGYDTTLESMRKNNATGRELRETVEAQREAFVNNAIAKGLDADAANRLADELGLIPSKVVTDVEVRTADAEAIINRFVSEQSRRSIRMNIVANAGGAGPTKASYQHDGSVLSTMPRLSSVAQFVPPGTPRVVGDRMDVDEAYIPLNHSARSLAILDETARRLGRVVMPMHDGALATAGSSAPAMGPVTAQVSGSFVRDLGDYLYSLMSGTGRAADAAARDFMTEAINSEAVVRR